MQIFKTRLTKPYIVLFHLVLIPSPLAFVLLYLIGSEANFATWIEDLLWFSAIMLIAYYSFFYLKYKYTQIIIKQNEIVLNLRNKKTIVLAREDIDNIAVALWYIVIRRTDRKKIYIDTRTVENINETKGNIDVVIKEWERQYISESNAG